MNFRYSISLIALATGSLASVPQAQAQDAARETAPSQRRALSFSVPLMSASRAYGDVFIEVSGDNRVSIDALSLRRELGATLNDQGKAALDTAIAGRPFLSEDDLRTAGFDIRFESNRLELRIQSIRPEFLQAVQIGADPDGPGRVDLPRIEPSGFSTYLNLTANYDYDTRGGSRKPDLFLDGATRVDGFVLEYEGALTGQFEDTYKFYRRNTRLVYDDPKNYRRYSAGDLRLTSMSILRTPQIGGVAIEKGRQIFDPFYSVTRLGGKQIFLDNRSEVDVLVNGVQYESLQLEAGTYDLNSLPIQQGSNDIQLVIRDSFGQRQVIDYSYFFEPLTLPAGEEEYSFGVGLLANTLSFQPSYGDTIAASGYYRKALSENLIIGGAVQATEDIQVLGATTSFVPQAIPGVFDLEVAGSRSDAGTGYAMRAGYRFQSGNALTTARQLSVNVDYESSAFTTIDDLIPTGFNLLSVSGSYSQSFGPDVYATVGGNYISRSGRPRDDYNLFFDINYRVNPRLRLTVGAEYGLATAFREAFGIRAGLTLALGGRTRASADYRSRTDNLRANLSRGADNSIGSFGYDLSFNRFGGDTQVDAQLDYISNRFEARANLTSGGQSFGGILDDQRARLQVGTSLALADGVFGIGRPIDNSFVLTRPHEALRDNGIVTARSLSRGAYYARSGALGAAVQGDLAAYSEQSVQYDAADPADGFDVGDGVVLVKPPYKSGYGIIVGSTHFVSVIGTIATSEGPIALATGAVLATDADEDFEPLPFYTNSAGRFGVFGLAPGKSYRVELSGEGPTFTIEVPEETNAVMRIGEITLPRSE